MAVVLADRALTIEVRSHPWQRDAHGVPMPTDGDALETRGPHPGAAAENADASWTLRVDPRAWPVRAGDKVTDDQNHVWVVAGDPIKHSLPGYPDVDYVEVRGILEPPRTP